VTDDPPFFRHDIFPESELPDFREIQTNGNTLSQTWTLQPSQFLKAHKCESESQYKKLQMAKGKVMQHAHMGFRDSVKSERAFSEI
jgi:hypothetical protein